MNTVNIFTDGACSGNGTSDAKAGYSVVVCDSNFNMINTFSGKIPGEQTNNRAELYSILKALIWINNIAEFDEVVIYSDSEIAVNGFNGECARKANTDIWKDIESFAYQIKHKAISLSIKWTKGHSASDDKFAAINNVADSLAKKASRAIM